MHDATLFQKDSGADGQELLTSQRFVDSLGDYRHSFFFANCTMTLLPFDERVSPHMTVIAFPPHTHHRASRPSKRTALADDCRPNHRPCAGSTTTVGGRLCPPDLDLTASAFARAAMIGRLILMVVGVLSCLWMPTLTLLGHAQAPCSNATDCNSLAATIAVVTPGCCTTCIKGVTGTSCQICDVGYANWPTCVEECTSTAVSCNGHATAVDGVPGSPCTCSCTVGYSGVSCERCASGYFGYPTCNVDTCTDQFVSCYGRSLGGAPPTLLLPSGECVCSCQVGWRPPRCDVCAAGYTLQIDSFGFSSCLESCNSIAASCNGKANKVVGPLGGPCVCTCFMGWTGSRCDTCEAGYSPDVPLAPTTCTESCLNMAVSCNGFGTSAVAAVGGGCTCTCPSPFTGSRCEQCLPNRYTYPICDLDDCSSPAGTCSNKGTPTPAFAPCTCLCNARYAGAKCAVCEAGYDQASYVAGCNVPDCTSVTVSCNGQASHVYKHSTTGTCVCECNRGYTGAACDLCHPGYTLLPGPPVTCFDLCTNSSVACNGIVGATVGTAGGGTCSCSCPAGFIGSRCQFCATGYSGWPECMKDCSSVVVSCNGRATSVMPLVAPGVSPRGAACQCACTANYDPATACGTCATGYSSPPSCNVCAPGYAAPAVGSSVCVETCLNATVSCNGNGSPTLAVPANPVNPCLCACTLGFTGSRCAQCAIGYVGYPTCVKNFCNSTATSCRNRASAVSLFSGALSPLQYPCNCSCLSPYAGEQCETCATGYGSSGATCVLICHVATSCSGHASKVAGTHPACACTCLPGYTGAACNTCAAGYTGYPNCIDECTNVTASCSGLATSVSGVPGSCLCLCLPRFGGARCASCAEGYSYYPLCQQQDCTMATRTVSCGENALSLAGTAGACNCSCRNPFAGTLCRACLPGFATPTAADALGIVKACSINLCTDVASSCRGNGLSFTTTTPSCVCKCKVGYAGSDCSSCQAGYSGYPNCIESCLDTAVSCNGHAATVTPVFGPGGVIVSCQCSCWLGYNGSRCEGCGPGYGGYPQCTVDDCTSVVGSCSNHASGVDPPLTVGGPCRCNCTSSYAGSQCNTCAAGFANYPNCTDLCLSVDITCNSKASQVTQHPTTGACVCQCVIGYAGGKCEQCAVGHQGAGSLWPLCIDQCLGAPTSCLNQALSAAIDPITGVCTCKCAPGYQGTRCQYCASGYAGYPNCYDDCTLVATSCSGKASAVAWGQPSCVCTCLAGYGGTQCQACANGFTGANCSTCAPGFALPLCTPCSLGFAAPSCTSCAAGFGNLPLCNVCAVGFGPALPCLESCSNAQVSCNGHGGVTGGSTGSCVCLCSAGFAGSRCDRCEPGYIGYPSCQVATCSNVTLSCNGRASAVSGIPPLCTCTCLATFDGPSCDRCADGYSGYPSCSDACSNPGVSCNSKATGVSPAMPPLNATQRCVCACRRGFTGSQCQYCDVGFFNYPLCIDECSNFLSSCGPHAVNMTGTPGNCSCSCRPGFAGVACDACAAGYIDYPYCVVNDCTNVSGSCLHRGTNVTFNSALSRCECTCEPKFAGYNCSQCNVGYFPVWSTAAAGASPVIVDCQDDCTNATVSCNGHATTVTGSAPSCACFCHLGYAGKRCEQCAVGFSGYPNCTDACLVPIVSCSGNGYSVSRNATTGNCACLCNPGYTGAKCDVCLPGYSGPYGVCLADPLCQSVTASCTNNAILVGGGPSPNCSCTCLRPFNGMKCEGCAPGYAGDASRGKCLEDCTSTAVSCNGIPGASVFRSGATCVCACPQGFTGARCDQCMAGFISWPVCLNNCTDAVNSCSGKGVSVKADPSPPNCRCTCKAGFDGSLCQRCAIGYRDFPECYDDCTNKTRSCGVRALSVDFSVPNCLCACQTGWGGLRCDQCALGWAPSGVCNTCNFNFMGANCTSCAPRFAGPTCSDCSAGHIGSNCSTCLAGYSMISGVCVQQCTVAATCSSAAWSVSVAPPCVCQCKYGFTGPNCERCDIGFTPPGACNTCATGFNQFPLCIDTCSNHVEGCNGNAVAINGTAPNCVCTCKTRFAGIRCDRCADGYVTYPSCLDACALVNVSCFSTATATAVQGVPGQCQCSCVKGYAASRCDACAAGYTGAPPNCIDACQIASVSCGAFGASVVNGSAPGVCQCTCFAGFNGSTCQTCAYGFTGYPNCQIDLCGDPQVSCYGHATAVGGTYPTCECTCRKGYNGTRCDSCDYGYAGYPNCLDKCDNFTASCPAGRATAVKTTSIPGQCQCTCLRNFTGPRCTFCSAGFAAGLTCDRELCNDIPSNCNGNSIFVNVYAASPTGCYCLCKPNFAGITCDQCANGYVNYPQCVDACQVASISCYALAAINVSGTTAPNCSCSCITGYAGKLCDRCDAGFGGWPNCRPRDCLSTLVSCNNRASSVSGTAPNCVCNCNLGFTGTECSVCAAGFTGYPNCVPDCTSIATSCSGHASEMQGAAGSCVCTCDRGFGGPTCGQCAKGYFGYPFCQDDCSDPAASCNGNGIAVGGSSPYCFCTCKVGYTGDRCDRCATNYAGYPQCVFDDCLNPGSCSYHGQGLGRIGNLCDCFCVPRYTGLRCDVCNSGYEGYPECRPDCRNVATSCNGHGLSVIKLNNGSCLCTCDAKYAGATCDRCAVGFIGFPNCVPDCKNITTACNGKAWVVDGLGTCICYCQFPFSGASCETCVAGRGGYPVCDLDDCTTVAGSCNSRASQVSPPFGGGTVNCVCTCLPGYAGAKCQFCQAGYSRLVDGGGDGGACVDACNSPSVSCNNRATAVVPIAGTPTSLAPVCQCNCVTGYTGPTCGACASGYAGFPDCVDACTIPDISCALKQASNVTGVPGNCQCSCISSRVTGQYCQRCKDGYGGFPSCVDICTNASVSCNGRGLSVSGAYPTCVCTSCAVGFTGRLCDQCAPGYEQPPLCLDRCSVSTTCSGNAIGVLGTTGNCVCQCRPNYLAPKCNDCAVGYKLYPTCADACTHVNISCSQNAVSVTTNAQGGCSCTCRLGWAGAKCLECAAGFNGTLCDQCAFGYGVLPRCDQCIDGYTGYPYCYEACTSIAASCHGNAVSVELGSVGACRCNCSRGFSGARCDACAAGFDGYPSCIDNCSSVAVSCGGRAGDVFGAAGRCVCVCKPQFRASSVLCDECAPFHTGFPLCYPDCLDVFTSCGLYATAVMGTAPDCRCTCRDGYDGPLCERCAADFTGYPTCRDACTNVTTSCGSNADSVVVISPQPPAASPSWSCKCLCKLGFTGSQCNQCDIGYSGLPSCTDACSHVNVSCALSTTESVMPNPLFNASNSSVGAPPRCSCKCVAGFIGQRCDRCATGFGPYPNCSRCAPGYSPYPHCGEDCTNRNVSCNGLGNASLLNVTTTTATNIVPTPAPPPSVILNGSSTPSILQCQCACDAGYAGPTCDRCDTGYSGYPRCQDDCTVERVTCHGLGVINGPCRCLCASPRHAGLKCDTCAAGFDQYPQCVDNCTVFENSCLISRAVAIDKDASRPGACRCRCLPGYGGSRCDQCAVGFTGFPNCVDNCSDVTASCGPYGVTVTAALVDTVGVRCQCACRVGYSAVALCGACAPGYVGYPRCVDACTSVTVSCSPYAASVLGPDRVGPSDGGSCLCRCLNASYGGAACTRCAAGFAGYPSCRDDCSNVTVSCTGNGDSVSRVSLSAADPQATVLFDCACSCKRGYAGAKCDRCAGGFSGYPSCADACTDPTVSCNTFGTAVTGVPPLCFCVCKPGYGGRNCGQCGEGFDRYPQCVDNCTSKFISCASRGEFSRNVTGLAGDCRCECLPGYAGKLCDRCAASFSGFPNCVESCDSVSVACNNHASSVLRSTVAGSAGSCTCRCLRGYAGARCDRCDMHFDGYPDCRDNCTSRAVSCVDKFTITTEKLVNETDPDKSWTCPCSCLVGYAGEKCDRCADGYQNFPQCVDACTDTFVSCGIRGVGVLTVPGATSRCECICEVGFTSPAALSADTAANGTTVAAATTNPPLSWACTACAAGYADFPYCVPDCTTVVGSCHGKATNVSLLERRRNLTSTAQRPGPPWSYVCRCDCVEGFDSAARCGKCSLGYDGYPSCTDDCTSVNVTCNGHATIAIRPTTASSLEAKDPEAASAAADCSCACLPGYSGRRCDTCSAGFVGYPRCVDACNDTSVSCAGAATAVRPVEGTSTSLGAAASSCLCTCDSRYEGNRCERCAAGYREGGFPTCADDCTLGSASCYGKGTPQRERLPGYTLPVCTCTCASARYDGGSVRCGQCAAGYRRGGYPSCLDDCTDVTVSCGGHGLRFAAVTSTVVPSSNSTPSIATQEGQCSCVCQAGFDGSRCETCAPGYGPQFPTCLAGSMLSVLQVSPLVVTVGMLRGNTPPGPAVAVIDGGGSSTVVGTTAAQTSTAQPLNRLVPLFTLRAATPGVNFVPTPRALFDCLGFTVESVASDNRARIGSGSSSSSQSNGLSAALAAIIRPSSESFAVTSVTSTATGASIVISELRVTAAASQPLLDLLADEQIVLTLQSSCFTPRSLPSPSRFALKVEADVAQFKAVAAAASGLAAVSFASGLMGAPTALADMQSVQILAMSSCQSSGAATFSGMDFVVNPLGALAETAAGKLFAVALPLLLTVVAQLLVAAAKLFNSRRATAGAQLTADVPIRSLGEALAEVRFPAVSMLVGAVTYRGMLASALWLIAAAGGGLSDAAGSIALAAGIVISVLLFAVVVAVAGFSGKLRFAYWPSHHQSSSPPSALENFCVPKGRFISAVKDVNGDGGVAGAARKQWALFYFDLRDPRFGGLPIWINLIVVALLSAWRPTSSTACLVQFILVIAIYAVAALSLVVLRPYSTPLQNLIHIGNFATLTLVATASAVRDGTFFSLSAIVAMVFFFAQSVLSALIFVKTVIVDGCVRKTKPLWSDEADHGDDGSTFDEPPERLPVARNKADGDAPWLQRRHDDGMAHPPNTSSPLLKMEFKGGDAEMVEVAEVPRYRGGAPSSTPPPIVARSFIRAGTLLRSSSPAQESPLPTESPPPPPPQSAGHPQHATNPLASHVFFKPSVNPLSSRAADAAVPSFFSTSATSATADRRAPTPSASPAPSPPRTTTRVTVDDLFRDDDSARSGDSHHHRSRHRGGEAFVPPPSRRPLIDLDV